MDDKMPSSASLSSCRTNEARFDLDGDEARSNDLRNEGFVVVKSVLSKQQSKKTMDSSWTYIESDLALGVDRANDISDPYNHNSLGKRDIVGTLSPLDSVVSNESFLNYGLPVSEGSQGEEDWTHNLADEFDQYKDQNLEKMRAGVEGSLSGFDGIMSQALTKALLDDDSEPVESQWGETGDAMEIEATALCQVVDWLKRKEGATMEEKGSFMQEILNKMVASVRHGFMDAELGTRVIHECAALLGLQLACDIPGNALIVTGMPKWVTRSDVLSAFSEFGKIESAAVSSSRRGFGLVRFKSFESVESALMKFHTGEIEVQDVAVLVKVLKSERDDERQLPRPSPWDRGY